MKRKARMFAEHGGGARVIAITMLRLWGLILALLVAAGSFVMFPVVHAAQSRAEQPSLAMGSMVPPLTGHLDAALTTFAKAFRQNGLVADIICPRVNVTRKTDAYWIFGRESQQVLGSAVRPFGNPARRVRASLSKDTYNCISHAEEVALPDEYRQDMPSVMLTGRTGFLMERLLLEKEIAAATLLSDSAKVTNHVDLAADGELVGNCWSGKGGQPEQAVEVGKSEVRKSGFAPNIMILGEPTYTALVANPVVKDAFKYTTPGAIGIPQLQAYFDIPRIEVARAIKLDEAGTVSYVWGDMALLGYVSESPSMEDPSGAKTFVWDQAPGTIGGMGTVIGRDPQPSAKTELLSVDFYYDQKVTAVETFYLILNTVA